MGSFRSTPVAVAAALALAASSAPSGVTFAEGFVVPPSASAIARSTQGAVRSGATVVVAVVVEGGGWWWCYESYSCGLGVWRVLRKPVVDSGLMLCWAALGHLP